MTDEVNLREFSAMVRAKRGTRGLRIVADEAGVSASTLSRVEAGHIPDLDTFARLCRWMGVSTERFFQAGQEGAVPRGLAPAPGMETPEIIAMHLRADRALDPDTADAIATMVRLAYQAVVKGQIGRVDPA